MFPEEIFQQRNQESRITDRFIFIRSIGLLVPLYFRMRSKVILVIEFDGTDNTEPVSQDTGFVSIAEMPVKVLLFDLSISSSVCRHRTISSLIRIIGFIKSVVLSPCF